jgi:hypothetical protein
MFSRSIAIAIAASMAAAARFTGAVHEISAPETHYEPDPALGSVRHKGRPAHKFAGVAASRRAARKRRNIRARSSKRSRA